MSDFDRWIADEGPLTFAEWMELETAKERARIAKAQADEQKKLEWYQNAYRQRVGGK